MQPESVSRPRPPISQAELDEVVRRHALFQSGRHGGQRAMLSYRDLTGLNLNGQNLCDGDLTAAILENARCIGTLFNSAILFGASLAHADMRGAKLIRADLRGASLDRKSVV